MEISAVKDEQRKESWKFKFLASMDCSHADWQRKALEMLDMRSEIRFGILSRSPLDSSMNARMTKQFAGPISNLLKREEEKGLSDCRRLITKVLWIYVYFNLLNSFH